MASYDVYADIIIQDNTVPENEIRVSKDTFPQTFSGSVTFREDELVFNNVYAIKVFLDYMSRVYKTLDTIINSAELTEEGDES